MAPPTGGDGSLLDSTLSNLVEEGLRLVRLASAASLQVRLIGGVAVCLSCPSAMERDELRREYKDLDLAAPRRQSTAVQSLLAQAGYEANQRFNALHGATRCLFYDLAHGRQLDVFLGTFQMCHRLDLESRLGTGSVALSPADLLLLKLQVVELNHKDVVDVLALILEHDAVPGSAGSLDTGYIAAICAGDWGWYTTVHDNLERVAAHAQDVLASPVDAVTARARIETIRAAIEAAPKSSGWRWRARLGRRVRWYEMPEEVGG